MTEVKETVLYDREKDGVSVVAKQLVNEVLVSDATEEKEAVYKNERVYEIKATFEGGEVASENGVSYRQTIQRARKLFKETHETYAPKPAPVEAVEETQSEEA